MKKLLMTSVIAVSSLFTIAACAQGGGMANPAPHHNMNMQHYSQAQMPQNMISNMATELNLTANQQAQIQAIRQNNRGTGIQNHNAMMQVLTPEQRQKLSQIQSQRMNQDGRMMNQDHGNRMHQGGHMMNQNNRMHKGGQMNMNQKQNIQNQNRNMNQ